MRTKRKARRERLTANPFVCMTDLMVALNAGLLVIGILTTTDPREWSRWLALQKESVGAEQELAGVQMDMQTLAYRYQTLGEGKTNHTAGAACLSPNDQDRESTLAVSSPNQSVTK